MTERRLKVGNKQKKEKTSQIKDNLSLKMVILKATKRVEIMDAKVKAKVKRLESLEKDGERKRTEQRTYGITYYIIDWGSQKCYPSLPSFLFSQIFLFRFSNLPFCSFNHLVSQFKHGLEYQVMGVINDNVGETNQRFKNFSSFRTVRLSHTLSFILVNYLLDFCYWMVQSLRKLEEVIS